MGLLAQLLRVSEGIHQTFGEGTTATLRRYAETPDPVTGETATTLAQTIAGVRVVALGDRNSEENGIRYRDTQISMSGQLTSEDVDVNASWTLEIDRPGERELPITFDTEGLEFIAPNRRPIVWTAWQRQGSAKP